MTKTEIVSVLQELKPRYTKEGFVILGLFGSYAKDEATSSSDVDILYDLDEGLYLQKYKGTPSDLAYKGFETVFLFSNTFSKIDIIFPLIVIDVIIVYSFNFVVL